MKCACRCHSEFHGVANRRGMEPLDDALGLVKEAPKTLGDLALDLELGAIVCISEAHIGTRHHRLW